jgi:hypothetical protein
MGMGKVMLTGKRALNTRNGFYGMTDATFRSIGLSKYTFTCKIHHIHKGCEKAAVVELFAWVVCPRDGVGMGMITPHVPVRGQKANPLIVTLAGWSISLTRNQNMDEG